MDNVINLDQFHLWNVNESKAYLHVSRETTDGGLEEFAARYVCQETFIRVIFGKRTARC